MAIFMASRSTPLVSISCQDFFQAHAALLNLVPSRKRLAPLGDLPFLDLSSWNNVNHGGFYVRVLNRHQIQGRTTSGSCGR
jgi:hypothetical protein